jgi:Aspartyl/Asparaginyl beta-hydroxylase
MKPKDFHFKYLGQYENLDDLKKLVAKLDEDDWAYFKKRTTIAGIDVNTIPIIFPDDSESKNVTHRHSDLFSAHIALIEQKLSSRVRRAILVRLPANTSIKRHMDKGDFLNKHSRIHIPIYTNDDCTFIVDSEEMNIPEGSIYEINNTGKYHSVHNNGKTDRIHLIVDMD